MRFVRYQQFINERVKEIPCIIDKGAPTTSTAGAIGLFYMNSDNGDIYKCTAAANKAYTWEPLVNCGGNESGSDYILPIGGEQLGGVKNGGNVVINEDGTMTALEVGSIQINGTPHQKISPYGTIKGDGTENHLVSQEIPVAPGEQYLLTCSANFQNSLYAIYDSNGSVKEGLIENLISPPSEPGHSEVNLLVTIPNGGAFMRVAWNKSMPNAAPYAVTKIKIPKSLDGVTVAVIGDSLVEKNNSAKVNFVDIIAFETGANVTNLGVGGTGYMARADEGNAFYQRAVQIPEDTKRVLIYGSGNDRNMPLGTPTDTGTDTLCGCINTTIDAVYERVPMAWVGIIAPAPWKEYPPYGEKKQFELMVQAQQRICARRDIPFLDLYHASGLRPWDDAFRELAFDADGVHPNDVGHALIAPKIQAFLMGAVGGVTTPETGSGGNVDLTDYAKEQWVQDNYQPKGEYLTEHQDISGKLDASALTTAIDTALAQAKASGEFDGEDGKDGYTPKKGIDYFDGQDGVGIASVKQTTVSTEDGGNNVFRVTLTDGNSAAFTVKNGSKGSTGADGQPGKDGTNGKDGYTPQKGVDYFDGEDGTDGQDGKDGTSPVVSVSAITGGHRITITDVNGAKTVDVIDGSDGQDGTDGQDGADGVSVTHEWDGTVLKVTSASGTSSADLKGEQGNDGSDGADGKDYSFDPTVYGLPVLHLTGDTSPIAVSKDNKATLSYVYGDRSGSCTLKGQGATSYKTAQALVNAGKKGKFNYTIKFDTAFEAKEGWGAQQKYCLKANFIDPTHSRNIVSCILWGMSVKARSTVPTELAGLPNGGAIDGFPIVIMLNGEFHGLYTWNIPKDGWMFGLVEDATKTQAIVGADDHTTATQFKEASMSGFEVEFASDEDNMDWVEASLTRLISAVMNSDGSDLDTTVAQYLDWDSAIDHYIHTVVDKAMDCVDKNYLLVTFDGVKWYMSQYDRDSIHGLNWDASGTTRPVSNISFAECAETVQVYELIKRFKTNALKARYKALRSNILSESRIMEKFENFAWAIPSPVMLEDVKLYPTIKGSGVNTIDQIGRFVRQRLVRCDGWIDALPAQETPSGGSTVTTHAVTNKLTNCTSSNGASAVNAGAAYSATISASDGYTLDGATVSVTMGGTNITSTAYSNGKISIASVTGAVVITVSAVKKASGYTNLVKSAEDTAAGSLYNGCGYKEDVRLSSSGGVSGTGQAGSVTTGFMKWQSKGIIRIKGATFPVDTAKHYYVNFYDGTKKFLYGVDDNTVHQGTGTEAMIAHSYDSATGITTIDFSGIPDGTGNFQSAVINATYFRINALGKGEDLIVTVNQEIT